MPSGRPRRRDPDDRSQRLARRTTPRSTSSSSAPHLAFERGRRALRRLRVTRPTISVVLRPGGVDTHVLTRAMQAGARDVVPPPTTSTASRAAVDRAHQLYVALRGPAGAVHMRQGGHGLLPQGRRRQDHDGGQPRPRADRPGRAQGLPGRPRPRVRRRRHHHAALPDPLDRARDRLRGLARLRACSTALLTRHHGLADGARGAEPPRRTRPDLPHADRAGAAHAARRASTTSSSTPRRPSTSRP